MLGQRFEHLEVELVALVPALDGAGGQAQVRIGDDARRIEELDLPEAVALRAGAHRVVEREQARLEFLQGVAALRAGELRGEQMLRRRCPSRPPARGLRHGSAPSRRTRPGAGARPARTLRRSTTTSMVCFWLFVSFGKASMSCTVPSTRRRTKPCAFSSANRSSCSPLRLATTGARIISLVSSGRAST